MLVVVGSGGYSEPKVASEGRVSRVHKVRSRRPSGVLPHNRRDGQNFGIQNMFLRHRPARR